MLGAQADTEAYHGRLAKAREFTGRATASLFGQSGNREAAQDYEAWAALREAEFGNAEQAKKQAAAVLARAPAFDLEARTVAALALGWAGDSARALATADDLNRQRPLDTLLNGYWLPTIRAVVEILRGNPSRAIELLQPVSTYDLSAQYKAGAKTFCAVYVRGEAYLTLRQGSQAAAEFQKILDHPGIVMNTP